ncbi:hypothetical protein CK203_103972 [Vitis vinifera]|uniref:Uncharacterized protein n=1 Tax=Vitis vinifera TaxID=29760 RepID=A0A438FIQ0_VITVI|nr:hypothetical protein CK203_103972 [Vitis vinifera]
MKLPILITSFGYGKIINLACYSNLCYKLGFPVVLRVNSAIKAWNKLEATYANKSHTPMLGLLDALTKVNKEGKIVADYMQELTTAIRARDSSMSFEELHDKLLDHESFLK